MIPQVAASERGEAQTCDPSGSWGFGPAQGKKSTAEAAWKGGAAEGDRPVGEVRGSPAGIQSTTRHEEPRGKTGGPPPKAKYYLMTDSGTVP